MAIAQVGLNNAAWLDSMMMRARAHYYGEWIGCNPRVNILFISPGRALKHTCQVLILLQCRRGCVFRSIAITDSSGRRSSNPVEGDHPLE
jgi:hypothetical protein